MNVVNNLNENQTQWDREKVASNFHSIVTPTVEAFVKLKVSYS